MNKELKLNYGDEVIDFSKPFRRVSMIDIVKEHCNIDFGPVVAKEDTASDSKPKWTLNSFKEKCKYIVESSSELTPIIKSESNNKINKCETYGNLLNELFEIFIESKLIQPTFIIDYPIEISPLAKIHREKKGLVERFELFIAGRELANSFSELTDPMDQRERFEKQLENKGKDVKMDEDFVMALEYGMPPTGGMGMGIDRLVMILTNCQSIRDVIAFPLLK